MQTHTQLYSTHTYLSHVCPLPLRSMPQRGVYPAELLSQAQRLSYSENQLDQLFTTQHVQIQPCEV